MTDNGSVLPYTWQRLKMTRIVLIVFSLIAASSVHGCGEHESLKICGRLCEGTCTNRDLSRCATANCSSRGCQCKEGYLRNESTDLCVPATMCPETRGRRKRRQVGGCAAGEAPGLCAKRCEGTCEDPNRPDKCPRCIIWDCGCNRRAGFVRDKRSGKCIQIRDCPK